MIISKRCTICSTPHHNRYICSHCLNVVGHTVLIDYNWHYCPFCGKGLYPEGLNREQRAEYISKLHRGE